MPASPAPSSPADRLLTPAQRRRLHETFEQGQRALTAGQSTEAARLLTECVVEDPGNLLYVATFLECLKHPVEAAGIRRRLSLMRQEWRFRRAALAEDWATILQLGPELLVHRQDDPFLLSRVAEACCQFGFREAELAWLRWATACCPNDADLLRQAARSLARKGRFDESVAVWQRLASQIPQDAEARQAIAAWQEPQPDPGPEDREACSRLHALERLVREDPTDAERYVRLADELHRRGRLDEAEHTLRQAVGVSPGDLAATERLAETQLAQLRRQLRFAEQLASSDPHPEVRELVDGLSSELYRRELEIADVRSTRRPGDDRLQLEVAQHLRRAGNFREALRRLDQISPTSSEYAGALLIRGECLQGLRQFSEALERYRAAESAADAAGLAEVASLAKRRAEVLEAAGE